jgi:glycosyltransferase involved in cell wall biosynthesis
LAVFENRAEAMSRSKRNKKSKPPRKKQPNHVAQTRPPDLFKEATRLAERGDLDRARALYQEAEKTTGDPQKRALIRNDLAVLAAVDGDTEAALGGFEAALDLDRECEAARLNLDLLREDLASASDDSPTPEAPAAPHAARPSEGRIAILSFLFNWPSTGGGIVHTYELAQFLGRAGYEVQHFSARFLPWEIGKVEGRLPFASTPLEFDESAWNREEIKARFRAAVDGFDPDHVIITDSWNIKPVLADAVRGYPYILRFQAMECLCPLNGVRLLADSEGRFRQCARHQLANPDVCRDCLRQRGRWSGSLHQAERALSGVEEPGYHELLLRAMREAEAVLVVNPLHEAMLSPYTDCVRVVTAGMDPARFLWPWPDGPARPRPDKVVLLFAGLVEEVMKGFAVLHEACALLWRRRQDFELVATADPPGQVDPFTRFVGWQSQEDLPRRLHEADVLVMPTIAQEALGRTAVEAMAAGRPVVASRLGGLPFTVADGATGLLFEPGDARDLAAKIETLLDAPDLRTRLGLAGRRRFEEHYSWDVIIERHYRPLLSRHAAAPTF